MLPAGVLAPDLLAVLACPKSKQPLVYFPKGDGNTTEADAFLVCPASRLKYRLDQGVPVLLVEEARELTESQVADLVARAHKLGLTVPAT